MKNNLIKWFMKINAFLIRFTDGRIGGKLGSQTILLLETVGRKTGQPRVTPVAYFFHEGKYLIVESNWGKDKNADWYLNLLKTPRATLQLKVQKIPVVAHAAQGDEYARLWKFAIERHPPYLKYQKMTSRHIPIVVFEAVES
jgi:deazaflavin-dependent oxidoreductase (nitroreductase family)